MNILSRIERGVRPFFDRHAGIKAFAKDAGIRVARFEHSVAEVFPNIIRPRPRKLTIAVTAHCNLRCRGCRYGRDFMAGEQLPIKLVLGALDDARNAGVSEVRFYGGEPLLHPRLHDMVAHAVKVGLRPYVTTNGTFLKQKIDKLYAAGLRTLTIGFYGVGDSYDLYTQRNSYKRLVESLRFVRSRYGSDVELQLNYVVMRPSCSPEAWRGAWAFAQRFDMFFHLDLISYSVPFFDNHSELDLHFRPDDREMLDRMVQDLLAYKDLKPERFLHSREFIRSVPDWVINGAAMRVPCDAYQNLWVGADGTVQLCDTAFKLGNLHEQPLNDILFNHEHRRAARDAFQLNCPNCICNLDSRIRKHAPSFRQYSIP